MKKIVALLLAICLMSGVAAFANEITQDSASQSASTVITTTIEETYTLTIPASLNIAFGASSTDLELTVSNYRLNSENQLRLRQSWDGTLNHSNGSNTISYSLKYNGNDVSSNSNPVIFTANGTAKLQVVILESAWNSAAAGEYSDTVTFSAAIVKK